MTAKFVQVDDMELARIQRDPSSAEALFEEQGAIPEIYLKLAQRLKERADADPHALERLRIAEAALKQARQFSNAEQPSRPSLSLDKAWHGAHYLLCGKAEPDDTLMSQVVLGGTVIGEDDEGFSGYGPARYFGASEVNEIARAFDLPDFEAEWSSRFDAQRMSELEIYPGWRSTDKDWVVDAVRQLRDFYATAAKKGHAVVTCIV